MSSFPSAPAMTEPELRREVMILAKIMGLLVHYCGNSRSCIESDAGLPDLIIAGSKGLIIAELKSATGMTTAAQDNWLWHLKQPQSPVLSVYVWRPEHLEDGQIAIALEAIR